MKSVLRRFCPPLALIGTLGFMHSAHAAEPVNFILNWIAGGDHAPYYYAKKTGLYAEAGIDLEIEQGKGSSMSSQRTGIGKNPIGLADLGTALVTRGKGADLVAVMNVYANSPYGMYWLKSSGIEGPQDLAGHKIGNPPWDAARQMWPALAKAVGMDPGSVTWVNVQPNAKLSALKSKSIDATTSFYNIHHIFQRELGDDMGFFPWKQYGINPYGMYWLKSSGIEGPQDLAGHKIGNPPWDAARQMWPALAKAVGMDPGSVTWVNVQPNAKLSALKSKSIDATTSFYNIHHIFQRELGDDMGFFPWKQYGINPYGNSIIVNGEYLKANRAVVEAFVKVTQKAFHTCVVTPEPCIDALVEANKGLKKDNELQNWALVVELMSDETSRTVALGHFDDTRMKSDYALIETYFNLETPFDVTRTYTNEFLDTGIRMPK